MNDLHRILLLSICGLGLPGTQSWPCCYVSTCLFWSVFAREIEPMGIFIYICGEKELCYGFGSDGCEGLISWRLMEEALETKGKLQFGFKDSLLASPKAFYS